MTKQQKLTIAALYAWTFFLWTQYDSGHINYATFQLACGIPAYLVVVDGVIVLLQEVGIISE